MGVGTPKKDWLKVKPCHALRGSMRCGSNYGSHDRELPLCAYHRKQYRKGVRIEGYDGRVYDRARASEEG